MTSSCGSNWKRCRRAVRPPTPESKTPIGEAGWTLGPTPMGRLRATSRSVTTCLTRLISEIVNYPLREIFGQLFMVLRRGGTGGFPLVRNKERLNQDGRDSCVVYDIEHIFLDAAILAFDPAINDLR